MCEKLVRDKIQLLSLEAKDGRSFRIAMPEELPSLLCLKLFEETDELVAELERSKIDKHKITEEMADCIEVLWGIGRCLGISGEELAAVMATKRVTKGGFETGLVLNLKTNPERFGSYGERS